MIYPKEPRILHIEALSTASPTPPMLTPITLSSTQAFKQPDFSYRYVIQGGNLGASIQDFNYLRVRLNSGTQTLIQNGQSQVNNVALKSLSITPSKIEFVLAGYTPFHGDRSQLVFRRSSSPNDEQVSNSLSWQVFN